MKDVKCEIYHDNFQNYKKYGIPKAQLVIADIPYNLGANAYASNPMWYKGGRTQTEKARLQVKTFLTAMGNSKLQNIFIFAIGC